MVTRTLALAPALALASAALVGCGGGSSSSAVPIDPEEAQRIAAATTTANNNAACAASRIDSFYWEIGDRDGVRASGSVGAGAPGASTMMSIASSSKWLYSAYVVQRRGVRDADVPFLNFTSGYNQFLPLCMLSRTVQECLADGGDALNPATVGRFAYSGGHMQRHAVDTMGMGSLNNSDLGAAIESTIGNFGIAYEQPQLAGGAITSAAGYAGFLRAVLRGDLSIGAVLGSRQVCTNPRTCVTAASTPIPEAESWGYSLGHWVENDPTVGDRAFSSPGALGFYPWIDATKTLYGILARASLTDSDPGYHSVQCGRLIRQAWVTGIAASGLTPTP